VQHELGVPSEGGKICIALQDRYPFSDRYGGDQAVDETPNRLPLSPASATEEGGGLKIPGAAVDQVSPSKQATQVLQVPLVAGAGKDLHENRIGDCDTLREQSVKLLGHGRASVTQELDPRRTVDEDHNSVTRERRNSSRSPSQPDPFMRRASSTLISAASSRNAKLIASRFVRSP
jgi:hypothetical protein